MGKILFLFSFLLIANSLFAQQNLVPNPSFEIYSACPSGPDEVFKATDWSAYKESPDYFQTCATISQFSVPNNMFGYQQPLFGNAYCGFWAYSFSAFYREIMGSQLVTPLIVGQKYFVSFEVALDNYGQCGTDKIGAKFSTIPFSFSTPVPINNSAQVYASTIITDTLNWTKIRGSFIADSTYGYIMLGNFFYDINTDTSQITGNPFCTTYYFIDNVCVSTDSLYAATWTSTNEIQYDCDFAIFPNPVSNGVCYIKTTEEIISIEIYDLLGKKIDVKTSYNVNLCEINFDNNALGFFFIKTNTNKKQYTNKILIIN